MAMQIIRLTNTDSTNDFLLKKASEQPLWEGVAVSDYQSNGKGMGSNKWESEPGKNLLFSILLHPTWLPINNQYLLSMAEAIAICEVLQQYTHGITIKWPNDIYWENSKLSGTRIDANINGRGINDMIIGTGINVNQEVFVSDAPNPTSLLLITKKVHDKDEILRRILERFTHYYDILKSGQTDVILSKYHEYLYRRDGLHEYRDAQGVFSAEIERVMPNGTLQLKTKDGEHKEFMFKEVEFII